MNDERRRDPQITNTRKEDHAVEHKHYQLELSSPRDVYEFRFLQN